MTSWSTTAAAASTPGHAWGAVGQLIRGEWQQPIQNLEGKPLEFEADSPTPGLLVVEVGPEVDGAISDFGVRFWKRMKEGRKPLAEKLAGRVSLSRVCLRDRYLRSPLNVRLAFEVLRALTELPGGICPSTKIEVETADAGYSQGGALMHNDWGHPFQAVAVSKLVFGRLGITSFAARRLTDTSHHREIVLEWADGKSLVVRPDQGVTFMQSRLRERFNFGTAEDRQADDLVTRRFSVEKRDAAPVVVYVGDIQ